MSEDGRKRGSADNSTRGMFLKTLDLHTKSTSDIPANSCRKFAVFRHNIFTHRQSNIGEQVMYDCGKLFDLEVYLRIGG